MMRVDVVMRRPVAVVLVALALTVAACSSAQTTPATTQNGISLATTTTSTPNGSSNPTAAAAPYRWIVVACGKNFLSSAAQSALTSNFTVPFCEGFGSAREMVWTVVGFGGSVTYHDGSTVTATVRTAPGGSMVAVLICSLRTTCIDPNSTHPFSEFTVYPAPDSRTPLQFGTPGMGAPFLALQNGMASTCDDVFDPVTGKWYSAFGFNPVANASHPGRGPLAAPPAETGTVARTAAAPTPSTSSCTVTTVPTTLVTSPS
jgi:hypothetical protein